MNDLVLWQQAAARITDEGMNRKLVNRYDGPYKVARILGYNRYQIAKIKDVRGYATY